MADEVENIIDDLRENWFLTLMIKQLIKEGSWAQ